MTATINGAHPSTLSDDVRVRVRAPETASLAPEPADPNPESAHARAIPRFLAKIKRPHAHGVRNFASHHGAEARGAFARSWLVTEPPPTIGAAARSILPARGATTSKVVWAFATAAGVFRFAVVGSCWLLCLIVAGRIRAAATLAIVIGLLAVHVIANHLPG